MYLSKGARVERNTRKKSFQSRGEDQENYIIIHISSKGQVLPSCLLDHATIELYIAQFQSATSIMPIDFIITIPNSNLQQEWLSTLNQNSTCLW